MRLPDLQRYLHEHHIGADILHFDHEVRTVAQSAQSQDVPIDKIAKSIVFLDENQRLIVVILLGHDKVDTHKLAKLLHVKRVRVANHDEVRAKTGYEAGAVPPLGYDATFLIDDAVLQKDIVYTGGGSPTTLLKITPQAILNATHAQIVTLRKT